MTNEHVAIFGIYPTRSLAENAVTELKEAGFTSSDISVLFASTESTKEFAHENTTKSPEGATTGAISGATIGGVLGWLAGIGSLAIPGVGPFIAAGPIMAALAGMGVGGTVGGFSGALIGLGIPEYEATRYEGRVKNGGVLLSVHAGNSERQKKAKEVLERTKAEDISSKSEADSSQKDLTEQRRSANV